MTNILLFFLTLGSSYLIGQSNFTLDHFEKLASFDKVQEFDTEARKLGFLFESKTSGAKNETYRYTRELTKDNYSYTIFLIYSDYSDGYPVIHFICSSRLFPSLLLDLKIELEDRLSNYHIPEDGCKVLTGNPLLDSAKTREDYIRLEFCYFSPSHKIFLQDYPKGEDGDDSNAAQYRIKIFKRNL